MKKRIICGLLTTTFLAAVGLAAAEQVPMRGLGTGTITSMTPGPNGIEITATGQGKATHLGTFTRQESILLNPATGTFTGTIVFTAADGSELNCEFTGGFTGPDTAEGTYTFTGGTGRFEDASGEADFSVVQSGPNFRFVFGGTIELH